MKNDEGWMKDEWKMNEGWMKDEWRMNEGWMKDEWRMNEEWWCMMDGDFKLLRGFDLWQSKPI